MRKVFVKINESFPGMMIAETVFNEYGAIVILEDTILDEHLIDKLNKLGIPKIRVYNDSPEIIESNSTVLFNAQYSENISTVKDVLHDISNGKNINIKDVENITGSMLNRINENRDIVHCINQIRDVDDYTYAHSINVSMLSMLLGKWLKLDIGQIKLLNQAGLLHDIGKAKIDPNILSKPGKLTDEEFDEIKKHPTYGYKVVQSTPGINNHVSMGILMHHERDDGTGYPLGIRDKSIHLFAKIIAVADIYDAMTSDRTYKNRESPFSVFEVMEKETFGLLDIMIVNTFLTNIAS